MKIFPQYIIAILFVGLASVSYSQSGKATIFKNKNVQASGLYHGFNKTKDTLILRSNKKINYLFTSSSNHEKDIRTRIDAKSYKLPLNRLQKGRNVLIATQTPLKIVFVVNIIEEFPVVTSTPAKSDLKKVLTSVD